MEKLEFSDGIRKLKITPEVLKNFKKFEQQNKDYESGGILLGHVFADFDEVTVVAIPNKLDKRERFSFIRAKIPAQKQINKTWVKSKGILVYLGEWHTHPEEKPMPSKTDMSMIHDQLHKNVIETDYLYLVIIGQNKTIWVGRQSHDGLIKLNLSI